MICTQGDITQYELSYCFAGHSCFMIVTTWLLDSYTFCLVKSACLLWCLRCLRNVVLFWECDLWSLLKWQQPVNVLFSISFSAVV